MGFGRTALGFCGLSPGALLRERPSSDAPCASMMDSDVGWHPLAKLAEHLHTSRRIAPARPRAELDAIKVRQFVLYWGERTASSR